jgi:hypothetical protein
VGLTEKGCGEYELNKLVYDKFQWRVIVNTVKSSCFIKYVEFHHQLSCYQLVKEDVGKLVGRGSRDFLVAYQSEAFHLPLACHCSVLYHAHRSPSHCTLISHLT